MTIKEITEHLIETEVENLLSCKDINIEWVVQNYNHGLCEAAIVGSLEDCLRGQEGPFPNALYNILDRYCDKFLDFHYMSEEIVNRYISEKNKQTIENKFA